MKRNRSGRYLSAFALALACGAVPAHAVELYVSLRGNDANPGTKEQPFATIDAARKALRNRTARNEPATVWIGGGIHYLPQTVVFEHADSGTKEAPVTYAAVQGEQVVISGGQKFNFTFTPFRDGILQAKVPADFSADQLFVNGERQHMARYPNFNPDPRVRHFNGYAPDAISNARAARWANPEGGFIHAMHGSEWGGFSYRITGKNAQGALTYEGGWQNNRQAPMHRSYRMVENIFEELDAPGEWFHDVKTSTLYYYPPEGTDMAAATVETARLRHLVEFKGTQQEPVRFVTLKGMTFKHTARTFMDTREPLLRSDWTTYRGGALFFNGAEDCGLERVTIDQVGGNAVFVNKYNRRVAVKNSLITKAGANGVAFVGSPDAVRNPLFEYAQLNEVDKIDRTPGPKTDDYPADCLIAECLITQSGRVEKQTAPVQISMAMSITIRHCSLYDVPRAGINISEGTWGGHIIEFCDVFDTVKETGDHGSFNSWGRDRFWRPSQQEVNAIVAANPEMPLLDVVKPIILRNNRWRCDHGWDIDLDDGSSRYEIYNNLCLKGGIKLREGYNRIVENNIMVGNSFHPHVWFMPSRDIFRRNIVFTRYQPIRVPTPWGGEGSEIDYNFLHANGKTDVTPATVLQNQSRRDQNSITGDAMFVDPAKGDYRVKDGSPALTIGFKNFPMDNFGVSDPALKAIARTPFTPAPTAPVAGTPATPAPPATPARATRDDRVRDFLGAKIKNIIGLGEVSAAGISGEIGAGVVELPAQSVAARAGLREGDVILKVSGAETNAADDILKAFDAAAAGSRVKIEVWRNQRHVEIEVPR